MIEYTQSRSNLHILTFKKKEIIMYLTVWYEFGWVEVLILILTLTFYSIFFRIFYLILKSDVLRLKGRYHRIEKRETLRFAKFISRWSILFIILAIIFGPWSLILFGIWVAVSAFLMGKGIIMKKYLES